MTEQELRQAMNDTLKRLVNLEQRLASLATREPRHRNTLPAGSGRFKVLMLIDNSPNPAVAWDYPRFH